MGGNGCGSAVSVAARRSGSGSPASRAAAARLIFRHVAVQRGTQQMEHCHQRTVLELRHFARRCIVHQREDDVAHARCRQAFQSLQIVEMQNDALYARLYHNCLI